jgi:hypothetical protein
VAVAGRPPAGWALGAGGPSHRWRAGWLPAGCCALLLLLRSGWRLGSYGHTVNQLFGTFFIVPK